MKVNCAVLVFYAFLSRAKLQNSSPCPNLLRYEDGDAKSGRWSAILSLVSSEDLNGVWVRVELDRAAEELTSKFGETAALNPKEYLIANEDFQLQSQKTLTINIAAKYDGSDVIPSVIGVRLNGRLICGNPSTRFTTTGTITSSTLCGTISDTWRWPWAVIIQVLKNGYSLEDYCGGVLISDWHVLTTVQCVWSAGSYLWEPQELFLYLGTVGLKDHGPGYQLAQVAEIRRHPNATFDPFLHNLAVLKLTRAVERTAYVTPVCFTEENDIVGKTATLLRYTRQEGRVSLQGLKMPIVPRESCLQADQDKFSTFVSPSSSNTLCGSYMNGSVMCSGLTGCGLVSESPDGRHWRLHGIETAAKGSGGDDCVPVGYVVFVNVTHYVDWLKTVTGLR